jgi:hypothetical protein
VRRLARGAAALAAVVLGWSQATPPADAAFTASSVATASVTTHSLATPVLNCNPGGLLVTAVTLTWPSVSSATTADPYASPPNSTFLADGYEIYRATGNGAFTLLTSPARTVTSYADSPGGLITTYRYKIRTKKAGWTGSFSNEVTASVTSVVLVGVSTTCSA